MSSFIRFDLVLLMVLKRSSDIFKMSLNDNLQVFPLCFGLYSNIKLSNNPLNCLKVLICLDKALFRLRMKVIILYIIAQSYRHLCVLINKKLSFRTISAIFYIFNCHLFFFIFIKCCIYSIQNISVVSSSVPSKSNINTLYDMCYLSCKRIS